MTESTQPPARRPRLTDRPGPSPLSAPKERMDRKWPKIFPPICDQSDYSSGLLWPLWTWRVTITKSRKSSRFKSTWFGISQARFFRLETWGRCCRVGHDLPIKARPFSRPRRLMTPPSGSRVPPLVPARSLSLSLSLTNPVYSAAANDPAQRTRRTRVRPIDTRQTRTDGDGVDRDQSERGKNARTSNHRNYNCHPHGDAGTELAIVQA